MPSIRPIKLLVAFAVIVAGGAARMSLERDFSRDLLERRLVEEPLNLSLREQVGQSAFIALLGGFRSLVASFVELESLTAREEGDWAKVEAAYALCTQLQPREYHYWDFRAQASFPEAYEDFYYRDHVKGAIDGWLQQKYVDRSIEVQKEGLRHLPEESRLMWAIARTCQDFPRNKKASYEEAAYWFKKSYDTNPKRWYLRNSWIYCLARDRQNPERVMEAWPLLLDMYNSGEPPQGERTPTGSYLLAKIFPFVKARKPAVELPPDLALIAGQRIREYEGRGQKRNQSPKN